MKERDEPGMDIYELTRRVLGEPETDPDSLERVRRRVRQEIDAAQGFRKRPVWSRLLPIAAALGLGIVLIAVLVVPTGRRAAAAELRQLGRIASTQQPLVAGRGEYLLFRSEELRQEGFNFPDGVSITRITRLRSSIWLASDRSGFRRDEVVSTMFETEDDRRAWLAEGSPDLPLPGSHLFGPGEAALHDVTHLPSEPERLLSILRSGAIAERPPGDEQIFILIGELLAQGDATP